jgi:hypothetical protein
MTARIHMLCSFHFFRRKSLVDLLAGDDVDLMADSGAFSAFTSGASVTVEEYAAWLVRNAPVINCAATLDVIGDPDATARNTAQLMELVDGAVPILPVFHVGSPWPVLESLCAAHPYVMLGGAVHIARTGPQPRQWDERARVMLRWIVQCHKIAREHGTRLHGLGLTRPPLPEKVPWCTVDSSYWSSASRTGSLSLFHGTGFTGFRCGEPKAAQHARLIRLYGGDPKRASTPGFGIVRLAGAQGRAEREWLTDASLMSWRRYETWLRTWKRPVPPPDGTATSGDGIKIYLAAGSVQDVRRITRCVREADRLAERVAAS